MSKQECEICYNEDHLIKIGSCNHMFCANCVDEWLAINKTCPKCRSTKTKNSKEILQVKEVQFFKKILGVF